MIGSKRCDGKKKYATQELAAAAMLRSMNRKRETPAYLRSYFHGRCGFWHLTSQNRR